MAENFVVFIQEVLDLLCRVIRGVNDHIDSFVISMVCEKVKRKRIC